MRQSLHHLVADAPWNDEEMLAQVRREVLPTMQKHGPVVMPGGNPIIKNPSRHYKFLSCDDINLATAPYVLDDTRP
jgi:hypothetical protein